jgi:hypothetical protein
VDVGAFLKTKIGPLPAVAWIGVAVVGIAVAMRGRDSSSVATGRADVDVTDGAGPVTDPVPVIIEIGLPDPGDPTPTDAIDVPESDRPIRRAPDVSIPPHEEARRVTVPAGPSPRATTQPVGMPRPVMADPVRDSEFRVTPVDRTVMRPGDGMEGRFVS